MKRVLVTGGAGFLGLNVSEALLGAGYDVVSFDRKMPPDAALADFERLPGQFDTVAGDIRDADAMRAAAEDTDAIIHGGAVTPGEAGECAAAEATVEINIGGTLNAVRAAAHTRRRRMVYLGSAAVYGAGGDAADSLREDFPEPAPRSVYAVSKFAAERLAQRTAAADGISLRCARVGSVFGPWEYPTGMRDTLSAILQVTRAAIGGETAILPRAGRRDWVYSRDVARAIVHMLDREQAADGPVNIGFGREWTVMQWCDLLARRFDAFSFRLAGAGEAPSIDYHGPQDRAPLSIVRLQREFGFTPQHDLTRAFDDYMRWLAAHDAFTKGQSDG